jgi:hypothetical protein
MAQLSLSRIAGSGCQFVVATSGASAIQWYASSTYASGTATATASILYGATDVVIYGLLILKNSAAGNVTAGPGVSGSPIASLRYTIPNTMTTGQWISYGPEGVRYTAADANIGLRFGAGADLTCALVFKKLA